MATNQSYRLYHQAVQEVLAEAVATTLGPATPASSSTPALRWLTQQIPDYFEPLCTTRHLSVRYYDWDPSRYAGDVAHMIALGLCLACLLRESGTDGVSFKAHLIFFLVFTSRFVNVFFCEQPIYLVIYKVLLWQFTLLIVMLMGFRGSTSDKKDTFSLGGLFLPTFAITLVFGKYSSGDHGLVAEILWIFSNYLEGIAMLPQYIYCYRDSDNQHPVVFAYVLAMGGYQMVFGMHWIFRTLFSEHYLDMSSLINGSLGVVFFADWVVFKVRSQSPLSKLCIMIDKALQEVEEVVVVQGRRRLSGSNLFEMPRPDAECSEAEAAEKLGRPHVEEVELADHTSVVVNHWGVEPRPTRQTTV